MTRHALVTGGSRGIGYATAARLITSGFDVVITGRSEASLNGAKASLAAFGSVRTLAFDASDVRAMESALRPLEVDVLVANVGVGFSGKVEKTSIEEWNDVFANNVTSAFAAIKSVLGGMVDRRWGRIITVGSLASHEPIRAGVAYASSKHALWGLTQAVALDTKGTGVTANMVAPAFVRTDMTTENIERIVASSGLEKHEAEQKLAALSSLNRLLEPDEVALEIMRFVADDAVHVTGTSVNMGF